MTAQHIVRGLGDDTTLCGVVVVPGVYITVVHADSAYEPDTVRSWCLTCLSVHRRDPGTRPPRQETPMDDIAQLPNDAPEQCDHTGCRRDHLAEVEYATNHTYRPEPEAVLGINGWGMVAVSDHDRAMVWDPDRKHAILVDRDLPGFLAASGTTVHVLHDSGDVTAMGGQMSEVERAVFVARLRAWANAIDRLNHQEPQQ